MANLQDYITDTSEFLRDSNNLLTTLTQLTRWINLARRDVCLMTGCLEALVSGNCPSGVSAIPGFAVVGAAQPGQNTVQGFQTIANVEKYPYAYATPFLQANNPGFRAVVEVKQVAVSWGSFRPAMTFMSFMDMQAYYRAASINVFNFPVAWATTGDGERGEVWLYPPPSVSGVSALQNSQGEFEWLCSCVPHNLYSANDFEPIPKPYTDAVKFKAASYAMLGTQRYGMAQIYNDLFADELGLDRWAVDRGQPGNYYYSN
jgi:hypothetical protein